MNLIAIETATEVCSVALLQDDHVTVELTLSRPRAHSENLVLLLQDLLRYASIETRDIDVVAVSKGPGSYTGLRIGVSTAKGLISAVDAHLVAVPTLDALAASILPQLHPSDVICVLLNARRSEVYVQAFQVQRNNSMLQVLDTTAIEVKQLPDRLRAFSGSRLWLVGNGARKAEPELKSTGIFQLHVLDPAIHAPSAGWIARLGKQRFQAGLIEDVSGFEPYYLKEFIAKMPKSSMFEKLPF